MVTKNNVAINKGGNRMKKCKKKGEGEGEMKRFNLKNKLRKSKQINGEKNPVLDLNN